MNILLRLLAVSTGLGLCACGSDSAESPATQNPPVATQPPGGTPNTPSETPGDTDTPGDHVSGDDQSEESPPGDEPPIDETPEEDPPAEEPPAEDPPSALLPGLTLIEPADARRLTPQGKMVFHVDETVGDLTTFAERIRFRNASDTSLVNLTFDADENSRMLILMPRLQLEPGERYLLEIEMQGVESTMSAAPESASAVFEVPELIVSKLELYNFDGEIDSVSLLQESPIHQLPHSVRFSDPGSDGAWFTFDDTIQYYNMKTVEQDNGSFTTTRYDDPGTNGQWFDDDDVATSGYRYSYHPSGAPSEILNSFDAGPDTVWFSNDDEYARVFLNDLDAQGRIRRHVDFDPDSGLGKGADNTWFTSDDGFGQYTRFDYENDFLVRKVTFIGRGNDNAWFTDDDEVHSYTLITYDDNGGIAYQYEVSSPGGNGTWFDDDDETRYFTRHTREADLAGSMERTEIYKFHLYRPVSEANVSTFSLDLYRVTYFDADGRTIFSGTMNRRGANNRWFDDDDYYYPSTAVHASENRYSPLGEVMENWWVNLEGPGDDGLWHTGDEVVGGSVYKLIDEHGRVILYEAYRTPGDDGDWLTRDDNLLQIRREYDVEPIE